MQVYPNRLAQTLSQSLNPVYMVFGDEPYQKFTAIDEIRQTAKNEGFTERSVMVADSGFDWFSLRDATQNMSLFGDKQLIELELPTAKPGKEGSTALIEFAQSQSPDATLIVHGPRVGKDIQRAKWFKQLDSVGTYVPCYPIEGQNLQRWIQTLAQSKALKLDNEAVAQLADYCEGNLLAGAQEIEKLSLIYPNQTLGKPQIDAVVVNQSRFNVFQLIDSILDGNQQQVARLLLSLESEGVEPVIILWALTKEWQTLSELKQTKGPINWQSFRIWGNRQQSYQRALQRLSLSDLTEIGHLLGNADRALKGQSIVRPYSALSQLCMVLINPALLSIEWVAN